VHVAMAGRRTWRGDELGGATNLAGRRTWRGDEPAPLAELFAGEGEAASLRADDDVAGESGFGFARGLAQRP